MAITIVGSFLLIIPIEFMIWLLALPAGLLIGYYANARSNRRNGPWPRLISNGLVAAVVTGLTMAVLILLFKALFFFADGGYPDFNRIDQDGNAIPPSCQTGADCVFSRYVAAGRGPDLAAAGAVGCLVLHGRLLERAVPHGGDRLPAHGGGRCRRGRCSTGSQDRRRPHASPTRSRRSPEAGAAANRNAPTVGRGVAVAVFSA